MTANGLRHFLDLIDIPKPVLASLIDGARAMKAEHKRGIMNAPLAGKTLAMVFDKPSTRTRVSFDVAMRQLGGEAILLTAQEMQLGRGETLADTARVLSRYVDAIMLRTKRHQSLIELAQNASVPVINGLTDLDYIEVIDGLAETDTVLVLPSASLIASQQQMRERIQRITGGGGIPGMQQNQSGETPPPQR